MSSLRVTKSAADLENLCRDSAISGCSPLTPRDGKPSIQSAVRLPSASRSRMRRSESVSFLTTGLSQREEVDPHTEQQENQKPTNSVADQQPNDITEDCGADQSEIVLDGEERDQLSLADVAGWALESRKRIDPQIRNRGQRSLSVQIDLSGRPTDFDRRASSAAFGMKQDFLDSKSIGGSRRQSMAPSFTDSDGVQLRGDKGRARKRSSLLPSSLQPSGISKDEWRKSFQVPYTPRNKLTAADLQKLTLAEKPEPRMPLLQYRPSAIGRSAPAQPRIRSAAIHYESFLPNNLWLEMKPKRYTKNHKHGNHFESSRKVGKSPEAPEDQDVERNEAYVWENSHQIWMMQKLSRCSQ